MLGYINPLLHQTSGFRDSTVIITNPGLFLISFLNTPPHILSSRSYRAGVFAYWFVLKDGHYDRMVRLPWLGFTSLDDTDIHGLVYSGAKGMLSESGAFRCHVALAGILLGISYVEPGIVTLISLRKA